MFGELETFLQLIKTPLPAEEVNALGQPERFVFGLFKIFKYFNARLEALEARISQNTSAAA